VKVGDQVMIEFLGEEPPSAPGFHPMKKYKVYKKKA
jgi:hypothetical protein